jgi:hypothetical protein
MRFGQRVACDRVFLAVAERSLPDMLACRDVSTNAVERHHLLHCLAEDLAWEVRRGSMQPHVLLGVAEQHMRELPYLLQEMERDDQASRAARGHPPRPYEKPAVATPSLLADAYRRLGRETDAATVEAQAALMGV